MYFMDESNETKEMRDNMWRNFISLSFTGEIIMGTKKKYSDMKGEQK